MSTVQLALPITRPMPPRLRQCRRLFQPSLKPGPYRLPHDVRDALASALTGFRNRDAAFALATFLARFWTAPKRLGLPFPIDRRAIAGRDDLELTESQVRGAIRTLELAGFLDRATLDVPGRRYQRTGAGELHRRPILFTFGLDYRPLFKRANGGVPTPYNGRSRERRAILPALASRPSTVLKTALNASSPKSSEAKSLVLMGEVRKEPPARSSAPQKEPRTELEAALASLWSAMNRP